MKDSCDCKIYLFLCVFVPGIFISVILYQMLRELNNVGKAMMTEAEVVHFTFSRVVLIP